MKNNNKNYYDLDQSELEKLKLIDEIKSHRRQWRFQWWLPILANVLIAAIAAIIAFNSNIFEVNSKLIEIRNYELQKDQDSLTKEKIKLGHTLKYMQGQLDSIDALFLISQDSLKKIMDLAHLKEDSLFRLKNVIGNYKKTNTKQRQFIDSLVNIVKNTSYKVRTQSEIKNEVFNLTKNMKTSINQLDMAMDYLKIYLHPNLNNNVFEDILTQNYYSDYFKDAVRLRAEISKALNEPNYLESTEYIRLYRQFPYSRYYFNYVIRDLEERANKISD